MKIKFLSLLISLLIIWPVSQGEAQVADVKKKPKLQKEQRAPIKVEADRLDAHNEKRQVIFTGSVIAIYEDKTIKADRIILHYRKDPSGTDKTSAKEPLRGGDVERIEAKGRVSIVMEERIATGDDAVFLQDTQEIILTGNATLREGTNIVQGHRVSVYLNENRGMVESGEGKRVTATIYTTEGGEKKR